MLVPEKASKGDWENSLTRYKFASAFIKSKRVLDIASGSGYGSFFLLNKGAKEIVAGDISRIVIKFANLHYRKGNLHFVQLDAIYMPFRNDCFDIIVSFETIEHLKNWEKFLQECKRCLKKGGIFIISTPNSGSYLLNRILSNPAHVYEFDSREFQQAIKRYFKIEEVYAQRLMSLSEKIKSDIPTLLSLLLNDNTLRGMLRDILTKIPLNRVSATDPFKVSINERFKPIPYKDNLYKQARHIIIVATKP
jgi:2-polyprenyl-3-methyl-5-hydroxy-6-metoxy-1,4-benzoquinol methylase